jgi:hypothetical protein
LDRCPDLFSIPVHKIYLFIASRLFIFYAFTG